MLSVGLVGSPSSGKTTLATRLFSLLKEEGIVAEFIGEEARRYISKYRFTHGSSPLLQDDDQLAILENQINVERWFATANPSVLLMDSSWVNALGYMSDSFFEERKSEIQGFLAGAVKYDLLFFLSPLGRRNEGVDQNRVHGPDSDLGIHDTLYRRVDELVKAGVLSSKTKIQFLAPKNAFGRFQEAYPILLEMLVSA